LKKHEQAAASTPGVVQGSKPAAGPPQSPFSSCRGIEALVGRDKRCLEPLGAFKDCPACPEMVAIPPGDFAMGSNGHEAERPVRK
jgi:formylglycine-generating enzyme required for sulfatase activity